MWISRRLSDGLYISKKKLSGCVAIFLCGLSHRSLLKRATLLRGIAKIYRLIINELNVNMVLDKAYQFALSLAVDRQGKCNSSIRYLGSCNPIIVCTWKNLNISTFSAFGLLCCAWDGLYMPVVWKFVIFSSSRSLACKQVKAWKVLKRIWVVILYL